MMQVNKQTSVDQTQNICSLRLVTCQAEHLKCVSTLMSEIPAAQKNCKTKNPDIDQG